jgi:hypothetical protein
MRATTPRGSSRAQRLLPVLVLLSSWAAAACGASDDPATPAPPPATTDPGSLPLEVLGPAGAEVTVAIRVDEVALASATEAGLVLTVHNLVEPDSAEVVVNGAIDAPVQLTATASPFVHPDGRVATARVALDAALLVAGDNHFAFRYTRQVEDLAAVSGYRVLAVALELGESTFAPALAWDEPAAWVPSSTDPAAIERGRAHFQDESRDGGPTCARCHADSGADLVYFGFSDKSIIERAVFHQFTRAEAEEMASYLRSLPVSAVGRPFRGPFQPGPDNFEAAGADLSSILADDAAFGEAAYGAGAIPADVDWDWPETVDTFTLPTPIAVPTWMRWLPRTLDDSWFIADGGMLADAERALAAEPTLEHALAFQSAAKVRAKALLVEHGDHGGRVELLRFAAVKLWDWSRRIGFGDAHHGFPDGSPAYPYEVGFAFFEAAQAEALAGSWQQTASWWWAQLAVDPGRALSDGERPLNWRDVLVVGESAGLGPMSLGFLHLYGSWEESRGALADDFGTDRGPVRLLEVPLRHLAASDRVTVLARFFARESAFLDGGGTLDPDHHTLLSQAWAEGCAELSSDQRAALRAAAPPEILADLSACP